MNISRKPWTMPQVREFALLYPTTTMRELMARYGRTRSAIKNLATKLGLRKTPEHIKAHCRLREGHPACGWNRGLHYAPDGSRRTQFKKGHRGARQRPVGSERITARDGVRVKVAEPDVWVPKGRFVWEQAFGPMPEGYIVRHLDGDRQNFALDNLRPMSRAEHARMNIKIRRPKRRRTTWAAPLWRNVGTSPQVQTERNIEDASN